VIDEDASEQRKWCCALGWVALVGRLDAVTRSSACEVGVNEAVPTSVCLALQQRGVILG
jgi:hypothetical protein